MINYNLFIIKIFLHWQNISQLHSFSTITITLLTLVKLLSSLETLVKLSVEVLAHTLLYVEGQHYPPIYSINSNYRLRSTLDDKLICTYL